MNPDCPPPSNICSPCRQSGKSVLKDVIQKLHRRAAQLQTIYDMLPENPTAAQDEALWSIVIEDLRR